MHRCTCTYTCACAHAHVHVHVHVHVLTRSMPIAAGVLTHAMLGGTLVTTLRCHMVRPSSYVLAMVVLGRLPLCLATAVRPSHPPISLSPTSLASRLPMLHHADSTDPLSHADAGPRLLPSVVGGMSAPASSSCQWRASLSRIPTCAVSRRMLPKRNPERLGDVC